MNKQRRFLKSANEAPPEICLVWPFSKTSHGYGRLGDVKAHRLSFEMHRGSIPSGRVVLHSCDNPICINPHHLSVGSQKDNVMDMDLKGRRSKHGNPAVTIDNRGEKHGKSKLTESQVLEIRSLCLSKEISQKDIALLFKISRQTVNDIHKRKKWSHLP